MATINGTNGADIKAGTALADIINGLAGNDTLKGGAGNDVIDGGAGTDKLYGEAGADILKSGTGIGYLDGGSGNDTLYYAPTTADIVSFGNYFSPTRLLGGADSDTLHIANSATATGLACRTDITMLDSGTGLITFHDPRESGDYKPMGSFGGIESLVLTGKGGADYYASNSGAGPKTVTGTAAIDNFYGSSASETFSGGLGDDSFRSGGGNDRLSGGAGADSFIFDAPAAGAIKVIGFEGAGVAGGDALYFSSSMLGNPKAQITTANGATTFNLGGGMVVTVDKVGIKEGVDWFYTE